MSITLYDIPAAVPGGVISRNTLKTRLALSFKGLSFKTEWVELSEIEPKMKEIGADPTSTRTEDGKPLYTVPVIHDLTTGRFISDSMKIAFYLEDTYPDRPTLFPHGARAPVVAFEEYFIPTAIRPGSDLINHEAFKKLSPVSMQYIRNRFGDEYIARIAKLGNQGNPNRELLWIAARDGFAKVSKILSENGNNSPFFYGDTMSYADFVVVACLLWMKASLGAESGEWKDVESWDSGRWKELLKASARVVLDTSTEKVLAAKEMPF